MASFFGNYFRIENIFCHLYYLTSFELVMFLRKNKAKKNTDSLQGFFISVSCAKVANFSNANLFSNFL